MRSICRTVLCTGVLLVSLGCPPDGGLGVDGITIQMSVSRPLPASGDCTDLGQVPPVSLALSDGDDNPNTNILLPGCTPAPPKATGDVNEDNEAEFTLNLEDPALAYHELDGFCRTSFGAWCITELGPPTGYLVRVTDTPVGVWDVICEEADGDFEHFPVVSIAEVTHNINNVCAGPG